MTFQPPPPPTSPTPSTSQSHTGSHQKTPAKPAEPDLITRYNLQGKISEEGDEAEAESTGSNGKKGWSSNRDERQSALQRRRDEMILAARRKMEEKIKAEKATAAAGSS